jgi:hypothetical protein
VTRAGLAPRAAAGTSAGGDGAGAGAGETIAFSGPDAGARLQAGILFLGAGALPLPVLIYPLAGWYGVAVSAVFAVLVVAGLRAEILVSPGEVVITRRWLFVPYRRHRAPGIDDVWYGGDWGEPEGALGVVVRLGRKEVHLGSPGTMHALYRALAARRPASAPRP